MDTVFSNQSFRSDADHTIRWVRILTRILFVFHIWTSLLHLSGSGTITKIPTFRTYTKGQGGMSALALLAVDTDLADHMRNGSLYFTWKIFPNDPNPSITAAVFTLWLTQSLSFGQSPLRPMGQIHEILAFQNPRVGCGSNLSQVQSEEGYGGYCGPALGPV